MGWVFIVDAVLLRSFQETIESVDRKEVEIYVHAFQG
jgi:hypothetical protein